MADGPLLVTVEQAAEKLMVSRTTVYAIISRGELKVRHIGRAVRIHVRDLEEYADRLALVPAD